VKKEIPIGKGIYSRKLPIEDAGSKNVIDIRGLYLKKAKIHRLAITPLRARAFLFFTFPYTT
jgi:hypothetical protein